MKTNKSLHTFVILAYKESKYLEDCIKSVITQKYSSQVIIATTTPNKYIKNLAKKFKLKIITSKHTNIGGDFDFAKNCSNSDIVTIAHQDDIYDSTYSENIIKYFKKFPDSTIIFTDYYEIRNNKKELSNINLKIKRLLITPLRIKNISHIKFLKRLSIRFGDSISCPAVAYVTRNVPKNLFKSNYKSNVDWFAWEKLSRQEGRFVFINKKLMGHRISESTETTKIINSGERTNEDLEILNKFWPYPIAKLLSKLYKKSEELNTLK